MAHNPERTARLFHFSHYACLIAWLLEWLTDHLKVLQHSADKLYITGCRVPTTTTNRFCEESFIYHISSMWFIDVSGMQIKLLTDLVTCLFWFTVHHSMCVFIGSENKLKGVFFTNLILRKNDECYFYLQTSFYSNAWIILPVFLPVFP